MVTPLILDWMQNKFDWQFIFSPKQAVITINPNAEVQCLPPEYKYPEGVLINAAFIFDSPLCGARLNARPNLDTSHIITISTLMLSGQTVPNNFLFCRVPPDTPLGIYCLISAKEWAWTDFLKLSIFNNDSINHFCLGYGWTLAVLKKPRPTSTLEVQKNILESQQALLKTIQGGKHV